MSIMPRDLRRRNVIGLLVVLAVLAAYYLTITAPDLEHYRARLRPPLVADAGGSAVAGDLTWRIAEVQRLDQLPGPLAQPLPAGTVAEVVTISRTGSGPDVACNGVLTDGTRRWQAEGVGTRSVLPPDGTTTNCYAPGPVQFTFIVPRDARPSAVDVVVLDERIMVRLEL